MSRYPCRAGASVNAGQGLIPCYSYLNATIGSTCGAGNGTAATWFLGAKAMPFSGNLTLKSGTRWPPPTLEVRVRQASIDPKAICGLRRLPPTPNEMQLTKCNSPDQMLAIGCILNETWESEIKTPDNLPQGGSPCDSMYGAFLSFLSFLSLSPRRAARCPLSLSPVQPADLWAATPAEAYR
jgi:hypothetical protein